MCEIAHCFKSDFVLPFKPLKNQFFLTHKNLMVTTICSLFDELSLNGEKVQELLSSSGVSSN